MLPYPVVFRFSDPKNIIYLVHVSFIDILLYQFLTDGLINILIFEPGHLCVRLGTLGARTRNNCWHLWSGKVA